MKLLLPALSGKFLAGPYILIITVTHNINIWREQKKSKKFHFYNISCITGKFLFIFSSNKPTLNLLTTSTNDW